MALLLAAIGLYGLMASLVRARARDMAVRLALGATPQRLRGEVMRESFLVVLGGAAMGVGLSLLGTRTLAALLFGVSPTEPVTLLLVSVLLLSVGMLATYLPARWITRLDPVDALRRE